MKVIDSEPGSCTRLFLGNLPKLKSESDICAEVATVAPGLIRAITYKSLDDPDMHRGFCFLDYETPAQAAEAKSRLSRCTVFGCKTIVDWADPEPELDEETMRSVRILFVRQTPLPLTERALAEVFGRYGRVERVKTLKNFAFVHFARRDDAKEAMDALDGITVEGSDVRFDVSWAKPPADKKTRERVLRDRERRMQASLTERPKTFRMTSTVAGVSRPPRPSSLVAESSEESAENGSYACYDSYRYDFNRPLTFACQPSPILRPAPQSSSSSRCELFCPCGLRTKADAPAEESERSFAAQTRPQWDVVRSPYDHGDGANVVLPTLSELTTTNSAAGPVATGTDIDNMILKFFHKVVLGGTQAQVMLNFEKPKVTYS
ncbi:uncharacterized protein LOC126839791 [Adelges cooleyi]|uniref:uncharacterized protein LOC126839791 n=1 Tax=Adelges cooleyi TaxID=133065 RepID=UPI00217F5415|nr:uncharacterized protein LOC126839791 [Adelges cooleyi]